jgi:hypothetical protein
MESMVENAGRRSDVEGKIADVRFVKLAEYWTSQGL